MPKSDAGTRIIEALRAAGRPLTEAEIAALVGQHRTSAGRWLAGLCAARQVVRSGAGRSDDPYRYTLATANGE
jgi:DNA-binding IclR family transcriptional regulator